MVYKLGNGSLQELKGVHPYLVKVTKRAIKISKQDFSVHDGVRTEDEQRGYVDTGVSRTMDSTHLPQEDGHGHAVDLVPYINGKKRWEWEPIYEVTRAVRQAIAELEEEDGISLPVRWGGCWQVINSTTVDPEELVAAYVAKRQRQNRKVFVDGPHFELKI